MTLTCAVVNTGEYGYGYTYTLYVAYKISDADGMALSIDNPGLPGAYDTYPDAPEGVLEFQDATYCETGQVHQFDVYSVGGTGPQAEYSTTFTGTHNPYTPPPFAPGGESYTAPTNAPSPTNVPSPTSAAPATSTGTPTGP